MFFAGVNHLPGQELRHFEVERPVKQKSENGRVKQGVGRALLGTMTAALAQAKPEEKERWLQLTHPVTHKIISRGVLEFQVKPGDVFSCGQREFVVTAIPYNVGDLNHWIIYYCEERAEIHG